MKDLSRTHGLIGFVVVALVISIIVTLTRGRVGETRVYQQAALRALQGEQFYRPDDKPAFTYPPFFVLAYIPLARVPVPVGRVVWYFVNLCLFAAIVRLTIQLIRPAMVSGASSSKSKTVLAFALIGILSLRFVISPIEYQSHDLIIQCCAMLAVLGWARSADAKAGFWSGIAAACKATPLLFVVPFMNQFRPRAVAMMLVTLAAATLLPDLLFTNPDGQLWCQTWHQRFVSKVRAGAPADAAGAWNSWNMLNQSLSGTLYRLTARVTEPNQFCWDIALVPMSSRGRSAIILGAQLAVMGWILFVTRRGWLERISFAERSYRTTAQASVILCAMLLLSPMSSKQHFCLLLAPVAVLVTDFLYRRRSITTGATLTVMFVFGTLASKDICGVACQQQLSAYGSTTWCTLILMIACGVVLRDRARMRYDVAQWDQAAYEQSPKINVPAQRTAA